MPWMLLKRVYDNGNNNHEWIFLQSVSVYFLWKIEVTSHLALLLDGVVFFHESAGRRRSSKGKGGVKKWRSMVDASEIPFPTNHRLEWC